MVARQIAEAIVSTVPEAAAAQCFLVSAIGSPVSSPATTHVRLRTHDDSPAARHRDVIAGIVEANLKAIPALLDRFVARTVSLY